METDYYEQKLSYAERFALEWNDAVQRLRHSGYDLTKIPITSMEGDYEHDVKNVR